MAKTKKVLFTSHTANFSKFNRPFMRLLKQQGYEIHYASAGEEPVKDCDKHFTIPFERSPFKLNNLRALAELKKIINAQNYDIIHTHTPMGSVVTRLAAINARKKGTRVIYTAHGFHFFKGAPLLNWLIYYPIEKFMARHTDTLITINKEDHLRASKKFKTDVQYIPGVGVDLAKFDIKITTAERNKIRKSLGLKPNDFVMIYVAEINKNKNQLWLIKIIAKLISSDHKIHLLLVGQDNLKGKCQAQAKKLNIKNNIHFLGYRNDIPQLMKISDLAVSASKREGLPVNIIEAMAAELPAVTTDCRGNRDLVNHEVNGFSTNQDDQFVFYISKLANNKQLATKMAKSAKYDAQKYLQQPILNNVDKIYHKKPVIIHLLNSNKFSGAENVACNIIKEFSKDYDCYYCSPSGDINKALEQKSVNHIAIKKLSYGELKKVVKQYKPSIIHAHDFRASLIAGIFGKKIKVISHLHQNPNWLSDCKHPNYLLYKSTLKRFSKVIVVSNAIGKNLIFKNAEQKVVTIYNKVNAEYILKKANEGSTKKYDLAFCGRLEPVKQPLVFIDIVSQIKQTTPNIRAVMIGDGSLRNECESLINELSLENNIDMLGFQDNPYKFLKNSNFLVSTSENEGFGLAIIEATILGSLVIARVTASLSEILGKNNPILYSTENELVKKLVELSKSPKRMLPLVEANMKYVTRFLSSNNIRSDAMNELYDEEKRMN